MDNIWSQTYATDQAAFLAGYLAASVTKTGKVAVFGGIDISPVTDFMDGYALGVHYYNQIHGANVEVLGWNAEKHEGIFIGDFCCAAEGREITEQLLNQGADIIFPVAGTSAGAGALYAVHAEGNAYIIGVDTDWVLSNPEYEDIILTSVVKNYDITVIQVVKTITENQFAGGLHVGTLATGEVSIAPFHQLDALILPKVEAELAQIQKASQERSKPGRDQSESHAPICIAEVYCYNRRDS
jgi:basic membrane protein A